MSSKKRRGHENPANPSPESHGRDDPEKALEVALQHHQAGRLLQAEHIYKEILSHQPKNPDALHLLGLAAHEAGRHEDAIGLISKAIENALPNEVPFNNLGEAYRALARFREAETCFLRALEINPNLAEAHNNLGEALSDQDRRGEAIASYRRAIEINPRYAFAHNNLGNALSRQDRLEEAVNSYRRAIDISPDYASGHHNLGTALYRLGRLEEAIACYEHALEIDPGYGEPAVSFLEILQATCSWPAFEALKATVNERTEALIERGEPATLTPFQDVMMCADPSANLRVARSASGGIARRMAHLGMHFPMESRRSRGSKITVGYLSRDYHDHPVGHLVAGLFGLHDREAFRILAYSHGADDGSDYRKRFERDCDSFVDIRGMNHGQAAQRIYDDGVDILVDLNGHTEENRLQICALRPAPVVVTYLGFPGTTGADFVDYILTDRIVTPEDHAPWYSEAFAYLPHCYQVNDHTQKIADTPPARADCGLPKDAFVFCSFNKSAKIEPVMFETWMDLLKALPGSVLWLLEYHPLAVRNLKNEAQARGVDADRLVFAGRLPKDQHLARLRLAGLVLDTRIYNGHTTTSDALWAGVPVITLEGSHFASRVSASILTAVGLPDLITHSLEEYAALAGELSQHPDRLRRLRERLAENRLTEPLFDTPRFVRNLESAYRRMWEVYLAGGEPGRIAVAGD